MLSNLPAVLVGTTAVVYADVVLLYKILVSKIPVSFELIWVVPPNVIVHP